VVVIVIVRMVTLLASRWIVRSRTDTLVVSSMTIASVRTLVRSGGVTRPSSVAIAILPVAVILVGSMAIVPEASPPYP
jgi:hypothetical protein